MAPDAIRLVVKVALGPLVGVYGGGSGLDLLLGPVGRVLEFGDLGAEVVGTGLEDQVVGDGRGVTSRWWTKSSTAVAMRCLLYTSDAADE